MTRNWFCCTLYCTIISPHAVHTHAVNHADRNFSSSVIASSNRSKSTALKKFYPHDDGGDMHPCPPLVMQMMTPHNNKTRHIVVHRQATAASYLFVQQPLVCLQQQLTLKVSWGQSVSSWSQNLTTQTKQTFCWSTGGQCSVVPQKQTLNRRLRECKDSMSLEVSVNHTSATSP